jgi:putative hydrolase of the HAD superfamily
MRLKWCGGRRNVETAGGKRAASNFKLELAELEDRHHLTFDIYEEGKLTMEEY